MLSKDFGARLVLEQFADNPFLPFFYENRERYAFPVELFFMTERYRQLQEGLQPGLFDSQLTISDYFFLKTLLFAGNNLIGEEFRLFRQLFEILNQQFPKPGLLVYLHRPVDILLQNIARRGRSYETMIDSQYLLDIQQVYFEYFRTEDRFPVLVIELGDMDFQHHNEPYQRLVEALSRRDYRPGLNRLSFLNTTI